MREWKKPEVKIFDVKMDENIAASGDQYQTLYIYYDEGGITRGGANYKCQGTSIQDTGIDYQKSGNMIIVSEKYVATIAGCLA